MTRRAVIVGAGLMGQWHLRAARQAGATVLAVVDADRGAASRLAAHVPGAVAAATLDDAAFERGSLFIHICTPPETHVDLIRQALGRDRTLIVEKPLAPSLETTRVLLGEAAQQGCRIVPVHQTIFQEGVEDAAKRLRSERLLGFDYRAFSAGAEARPAHAAAIAEDILPHPLSLLDRLVPGALEDLHWMTVRPTPGEISASAVCRAVLVRILISMHIRPPRHELVLYTDASTTTIDLFHGFAWHAPGTTSRRAKITRPFGDARAIGAAAAFNLAARAARREPAYPGLRALVRHAYAGDANVLLDDRHTLAVASARDSLLREGPL